MRNLISQANPNPDCLEEHGVTHLDDRQLLIETHRGDSDAAVALWSRFGPRMVALAATVLRERDMITAQDVVQGVFVRLLALDARVVRQVEDVAAWLARLTRNAALNHIRECSRRRARVQRATEGKVVFQAPATGEPSLPPDLQTAIEALPDDQRDALLLKHVGGLTFDQMADALGQNRNTIASRYRAGLSALRRLLGVAPADSADIRPGARSADDGRRTPPLQLLATVPSGGPDA